jgi:hypothetical protein
VGDATGHLAQRPQALGSREDLRVVLGGFALRDIHRNAHQSNGYSVCIVKHATTHGDPVRRTVTDSHTVLAVQRILEPPSDRINLVGEQRLICRADECDKRVDGSSDVRLRHPEHALTSPNDDPY